MKRLSASRLPHRATWTISSLAATALTMFCALLGAETSEAQQTWAQTYGFRSYDVNGAATTSTTTGSGSDYTTGIAQMPDGGYVVAGQIDLPELYLNGLQSGTGQSGTAALVRYASDGQILWQRMIRQDNDGFFAGLRNIASTKVNRLLADAQGNIFVIGGKGNGDNESYLPFAAKFDSTGALLWQRGIFNNRINPNQAFTGTVTRDGGVLVALNQDLTASGGSTDPALAKLNSDGSLAFYAVYDQALQYLEMSAIAESATENNVFVAVVRSGFGVTLLRIDGSGNLLAVRDARDTVQRFDTPVAVVATPDGGFATLSRAGQFATEGVVLRKFDQDLAPTFAKWIQRVNSTSNQFNGDNFVAEADGGFLIGGNTTAQQSGGPPIAPGGGGTEAVIMRVSAGGVLEFVSAFGGPSNEGRTGGQGQPIGATYVLRAADGGYAFTTYTFSYRGEAVPAKSDWWTATANAQRRVAGYADLMADLPLAWFSVTNVPDSGAASPTFTRVAGNPTTATTGANFIIVDLANNTGANKPDVFFQGSSLPRIVSSNTAEAIVGQHFSYRILADFIAPGATLTYTATGLPENFRLNSNTGILSGAPRPGSETTEPIAITLQLSDGTNTIEFVLRLTISVGPPRFSVNGRNEPVYPGSAPAVTGLADQPLRFSANYGGRQAGQFVGVQVSTNPGDPASWQSLGNATEGFMVYDTVSDSYVLNSTAYPQAAAVYFRANVKTNGRADSASNVVGPFNLSSTAQRLDKTTLYITRNGPVANIRFGVTQQNPPAGVSVRVQSTTTPSSESTWTTVSFLTVDPNDARQFYLDRDDYPVGDGVYFRAIATASGYVQSISGPQGPFTFIHDPAAQVTITIPSSVGSGGTSFNSPLTPTSSSFTVTANATGAGRQLSSLNLLYDGDRIDRFIGGTTNGSTQYNTSVAGHHVITAVAIDDLGVTGHARPVHVHVRPSGGKIYRRTSSGIWADPAAWVDESAANGIPGVNDFAVLSGFDVSVANAVTLRAFSLNGGKITGAGKITITGFATLGGGSIRNDMEIADGATLLLVNDQNVQLGGTIVNRGRTKFHGRGGIIGVEDPAAAARGDGESPDGLFDGIKAVFVNIGKVIVQAIAGGRGQTAPQPRTPDVRPIVVQQVQNQGEITATAPDGGTTPPPIAAPPVSNSGSGLVDANGNKIISGGAGNIISGGAGNIISGGGGNIISGGAGNIISGGAGNIVAVGSGNIISGGAGNIISGGAGNRPSSGGAPLSNGIDAATATPGFVQTAGRIDLTTISITATTQLNGGVLSGSGVILGDVTNDGALIEPGNSPGSMAVIGSFSQNAGGTLRIEAEGGEAHQFDQLQVGGPAALGGTLDLQMIGGYIPLPDDAFVPLGYASVIGQFHTVSSNASVAVTATGIVTVLDPTQAPPFALIRAVSRKTHTGAGSFDVTLPVTGSVGVEPRRSNPVGDHQLVLTLSEAATVGGVSVTGGTASVSSASFDGAEVTVNLTGVNDQQIVTISLTNVNNGTSTISPSLSVGFLLGDGGGDGTVNAGDVQGTRNRSGQSAGASNYRFDANCDGTINGGDATIVKGRSGNTIYP